jgi:hypothetical protein
MKVTLLESATIPRLLLESSKENPVRDIARGIDRLSQEPPQSPMLIKHRPGHSTQGSVLSFHHAILRRHIQTQKLVFKTKVMAKGFETRVFKF